MCGRKAIVWLVLSTLPLAGCAALQADPMRLERENAELRRMVNETRRELNEVKRDQERLRASVEYLQYGKTTPPRPRKDAIVAGSSGGYEPPSRAWPAGRWPGGGADPSADSTGAGIERYPYGPGGDMIAEGSAGEPPEATVTTRTGPGPLAAVTSTPEGSGPGGVPAGGEADDNPDARVVMGVRNYGNWAEPGNVPQAALPAVPSALEGTLYSDGVRAMGEEQYDEAIQYFRDFIHADTTSPVADDAQYWIAECYRRKGMETAAIKEFNQVVLRYASGDRGAAALLQLAALFSKIGDQVDARLSLQKLINRYPRSGEASQARRWLQQMGG